MGVREDEAQRAVTAGSLNVRAAVEVWVLSSEIVRDLYHGRCWGSMSYSRMRNGIGVRCWLKVLPTPLEFGSQKNACQCQIELFVLSELHFKVFHVSGYMRVAELRVLPQSGYHLAK